MLLSGDNPAGTINFGQGVLIAPIWIMIAASNISYARAQLTPFVALLWRSCDKLYRTHMSGEHEAEIRASVGVHQDLGPGYDDVVAEGLVERIGAEIDKRIDVRLGLVSAAPRAPEHQAPPPAPARQASRMPAYFPLASMGLGVGATAIVTGQNGAIVGQVFMIALIWLAIAIINVAYARRH